MPTSHTLIYSCKFHFPASLTYRRFIAVISVEISSPLNFLQLRTAVSTLVYLTSDSLIALLNKNYLVLSPPRSYFMFTFRLYHSVLGDICRDKLDGNYTDLATSQGFVICSKGKPTHALCPYGQLFSSTSKTCAPLPKVYRSGSI